MESLISPTTKHLFLIVDHLSEISAKYVSIPEWMSGWTSMALSQLDYAEPLTYDGLCH